MKLFQLIGLTLIISATTVSAIGTDQLVKERSDRLADDLSLDSNQTQAVISILSDYAQKILAKTDQKPNPGSTPGRQQHLDAENDIIELLNSAQKEKLALLDYPLVYNPQLIKLNHLLDLQKDQVRPIESILEYYQSQFRQLLEDDSGSRRSRFRKLRDLMESQNDKIEAELTDSQQKIYNDYIDELKKEMKNHRRGRRF